MKKSDAIDLEKEIYINNSKKVRLWKHSFCVMLVLVCLIQTAVGKDPVVLGSFDKSNSMRNWVSVNDSVMGGISKGGFERTPQKTLLFSGDLSLENNGGFVSIRTKPRSLNLAGAKGIVVKAKGDGRTYWFELRTSRQSGASSFRAYLKTDKNKFKVTLIPLSEFKLQAFGRQLPSRGIDSSVITSYGFTIADKKQGPFKLEVESVKAVFRDEEISTTVAGGSIADIAASASNFKTLMTAVAKADMTEALKGDGPLTVFAPTDEAFSQLPAGTLKLLLKPENKQKLADILEYHVISGSIQISKALEAGNWKTLQGGKLSISFKDGRVRVGSATVTKTPIQASNGIIYVIDKVLLPPETANKPLTPEALVELAIDRGVPLFNNESPEACVAVYELTCEALRMMPSISKESRKDLDKALAKMKLASTDREKAWILRYALDSVFTRRLKNK